MKISPSGSTLARLFCLCAAVLACSGGPSPGAPSDDPVASGGESGGTARGGSATSVGGATVGGTSAALGGTATGDGQAGAAAQGKAANRGGGSSAGGDLASAGSSNRAGATSASGDRNTGGTRNTGGGSNGGASLVGGRGGNGGVGPAGGVATNGGTPAAAGNVGQAGVAGVPYRGVANSPCSARTNLKVSWYYNWMQTANEPCSTPSVGGEFVPMVWGHTGAEVTLAGIRSAVASMVSRGNKTVLGFNEPDNATQSNISVATAISLWPAFDNAAIRVGSPATQANTSGVTWYKDFNTQLNASASLRADFVAIHWYGWNAGSCDAKAATLEAYIKQIEALPGNRPIWLTEWGCLNNSDNGSPAVTQAHIAGAVEMFARHPRLERYAWYPWAGASHALANSDGSLTELGTFYASLPAYK